MQISLIFTSNIDSLFILTVLIMRWEDFILKNWVHWIEQRQHWDVYGMNEERVHLEFPFLAHLAF
jgi:hypothetical protein